MVAGRGDIQQGAAEMGFQAAHDNAIVFEAFHILEVSLLMIAGFGDGRVDVVGAVVHPEAAIREARAGRVDVNKGAKGVIAAGDAPGTLILGHPV